MASIEDHDWWSDVQHHRDELVGDGPRRRRPVAVWTDDEIDLVPAAVLERPYVSDEVAGRRFVRTEYPAAGTRGTTTPTGPRGAVTWSGRRSAVAAEVEPRSPATRRTVRITGDASGATAAVPAARRQVAERRPSRSTREKLAHSPDRMALYAALLGFLLILLAFVSSDASAATLAVP